MMVTNINFSLCLMILTSLLCEGTHSSTEAVAPLTLQQQYQSATHSNMIAVDQQQQITQLEQFAFQRKQQQQQVQLVTKLESRFSDELNIIQHQQPGQDISDRKFSTEHTEGQSHPSGNSWAVPNKQDIDFGVDRNHETMKSISTQERDPVTTNSTSIRSHQEQQQMFQYRRNDQRKLAANDHLRISASTLFVDPSTTTKDSAKSSQNDTDIDSLDPNEIQTMPKATKQKSKKNAVQYNTSSVTTKKQYDSIDDLLQTFIKGIPKSNTEKSSRDRKKNKLLEMLSKVADGSIQLGGSKKLTEKKKKSSNYDVLTWSSVPSDFVSPSPSISLSPSSYKKKKKEKSAKNKGKGMQKHGIYSESPVPSDYLSSQPSSSAYPTSFSLKGDIVGKGKMMTESQGKGSFKGMKIKSKGKEKEKSKKISKPTLFSDYPTFTPSFPPVKKKDKSNKKGMGGDSLKNVGLSSKAPIQASSTKSPALQPSQSSPPAILPTSVSPTNIQLLDGPTISPLTTAPSQPSNSGSPTSAPVPIDVRMAPLTVRYDINRTRIPLNDEIGDVGAITNDYLNTLFLDSYADMMTFSTLLNGSRFLLSAPFEINYVTSASFPAGTQSVPSPFELEQKLLAAFTSPNDQAYLDLLRALPNTNIFSTTTNLTTEMTTVRVSSTTRSDSWTKATIGATTGAMAFMLMLGGVVCLHHRRILTQHGGPMLKNMRRNGRNSDCRNKIASYVTTAGDTYPGNATVWSGTTDRKSEVVDENPYLEEEGLSIGDSSEWTARNVEGKNDMDYGVYLNDTEVDAITAIVESDESDCLLGGESSEVFAQQTSNNDSASHHGLDCDPLGHDGQIIANISADASTATIGQYNGLDNSANSDDDDAYSLDEHAPLRVVDLIKRFSPRSR